jgi:D-arabinose 1-dehydrogenase-like Zn-dependent alcohol dehydrogenase
VCFTRWIYSLLHSQAAIHPIIEQNRYNDDTRYFGLQSNGRDLAPVRTNGIIASETDVLSSTNMVDYQINKFICFTCDTDFGTKKILERHMRQIHEAYQQIEKGQKNINTHFIVMYAQILFRHKVY